MLPEAFLTRMQAQLGDEYADFLRAMERAPERALRLNPIRQNVLNACREYIEEQVPWEALGYYYNEDSRPGASLLHAAGAFYIQDASAMAPVNALDPKQGETILDLCAAPGGKSGQIAARMMGGGVLVSNEFVKSRAALLRSNLERLGVTNAVVTSAAPEAFKANGEQYDAVLVDAPCSGEGMFRKDETAINEWNADAPLRCQTRQLEILDAAAETLKAGGRLVYSTCTFNDIENEGTIARFLTAHADFEPSDFELSGIGRSSGGMLRLWPHRIRGEGHFVCKLVKRGIEESKTSPNSVKRDGQAAVAAGVLKDMCAKALPKGEYALQSDGLYLIPGNAPRLKGVYIISPGLKLAEISSKQIKPAHALAMSLDASKALRTAELTGEQAASFMEGEEIALNGEKGWMLVCYKGMPLGWGKQGGGVLKNHLPKGLRLRGGHALKA
ncbi:MAG: RsmF rRNA methyltransferase first C-terminal domain-containing protein [Clostridia bacterium]|nr:RsmF rRNA methyltransferase first C-terminal domain-containing protein [Clostridia bacterium]